MSSRSASRSARNVYSIWVLQDEVENNSNDETDKYNETWSSRLHIPKASKQNAAGTISTQNLKKTANNFLRKGNYEQAIKNYTTAIDISGQNGLEGSQLAVLHCNRALAHNRNGSYTQASQHTCFSYMQMHLNSCEPRFHTTCCFGRRWRMHRKPDS